MERGSRQLALHQSGIFQTQAGLCTLLSKPEAGTLAPCLAGYAGEKKHCKALGNSSGRINKKYDLKNISLQQDQRLFLSMVNPGDSD